MKAQFDHTALQYDDKFTNTLIGNLQRKLVWNYLNQILPDKPINILELNCGTGEDAIFFAEKGHYVTATDASDEMLKVAKNKSSIKGLEANILYNQLDIYKLDSLNNEIKYDLIFSNFAGLNCIEKEFIQNKIPLIFENLLKSEGKLVVVFLSKFCIWESLYFLYKKNMKEIFRRNTNKKVLARVESKKVPIWYYSPNEIIDYFSESFKEEKLIPIGFFLPPSYLESFFLKKPTILKALNNLEKKISNIPFIAKWSDHFLIEFMKR